MMFLSWYRLLGGLDGWGMWHEWGRVLGFSGEI